MWFFKTEIIPSYGYIGLPVLLCFSKVKNSNPPGVVMEITDNNINLGLHLVTLVCGNSKGSMYLPDSPMSHTADGRRKFG